MPRRAATKCLPQSRYAWRSSARNEQILFPLPQSTTTATGGSIVREQILIQPEGYIGSLQKCTQKLWVCDCEGILVRERVVTYVPGLLRIFDEIHVYAADNKQRDPTMDTLRVDIDVIKGRISVFNNGKGIPIELHREKGVYVPEVIFGHLSNYCDHNVEEERNGYDIKLANIFSTEFVVETADGPGQKKYKQVTGELQLRDDLTCWDALLAALPVGTVSGAPKVRAMELIDQLEVAGSIISQEWVAHRQAGAGIVADSKPDDEHRECLNKAAGLARAIDLAESTFLDE